MTTFFHIVGTQGVGKSTLARHIVEAYTRHGQKAIALIEAQVGDNDMPAAHIDHIRQTGIRLPYAKEPIMFDVVVAEYTTHPSKEHTAQGDTVITVERVE